ncbi:hypothetical protein ACFRCI_40255 [Streptomyces sp. NPDC056638]|uniref:hypothetical protein n=1 Tax=Streptomyces sp. NPDC056638 TaxID=3345887 RepID=UPI0036AF6DFC
MALSHQQRDQIERRILRGHRQVAGRADPAQRRLRCQDARPRGGISRASFYRTWGHLKDEFEKRRAAAWAAGQRPDPREARIARLHDLNQRLTGKLAHTHTELTQLKEHDRHLLSVLAAKEDELQRLRRQLDQRDTVGNLRGSMRSSTTLSPSRTTT